MNRNALAIALSLVLAAPLAASLPHAAVAGSKAAMSTGDVVDGAMASADHETLVAAVKAAGLVDTLKGRGPFTVFAPTDAAFEALPAGTVDTLLQPQNKAKLGSVLTYHVVPGKVDATTLAGQIQAGNGSARLTTVEGEALVARLDGSTVTLTDAQGNTARVTAADVMQSNGVIHVIDTVLMP
ncbi:fasciclin domain-containing protein [Lysobacter sp. SG-8]|uniref:Fasciclin domain-containing protein n=1 Tax=Marilutibacter penaei TaxID=2759900 RepID=A0A7W3U3V6_9GAMM|nr:fasciclin domain-containing protein [Lysobacter penaei]MBB1088419.1 fasciclin domain-containing protein [Lysobacter penaei]